MEDFNPDDEPKEPQREEEEESDLVGHEKSSIYSHVDQSHLHLFTYSLIISICHTVSINL